MNVICIENEINFASIDKLANDFSNIKAMTEVQFKEVFSRPAGIVYLSSLMNKNKNLIQIQYSDKEHIQYLQRANFFENLAIHISEDFQRHKVSTNMLECTKIQKDDDPDFVDKRLKKILQTHLGEKTHLILGILLTTYEIVDNILEHSSGGEFKSSSRTSDAPGFVCAQYYGKSEKSIEIGISDSGIGIVNSLKDAYSELARETILQKAFESNITRHKQTMPSRGNGLAKLKEFVLETNGEIECRTNEFVLKINNQHVNGIIQKKSKDLNGTHFKITIGCDRDIDTKKIFNAVPSDYEDNEFDDFFDM